MSEEKTGAGRPTLYDDEMQARADRYLSEYEGLGDAIPSRSGLSLYLGVARSTVALWGTLYERFSDTLDQIQAQQEVVALNKGITGVFNPTITKLVLANHGYSDRQEIDHTSNGKPIAPTRIEIVAPDVNSTD